MPVEFFGVSFVLTPALLEVVGAVLIFVSAAVIVARKKR